MHTRTQPKLFFFLFFFFPLSPIPTPIYVVEHIKNSAFFAPTCVESTTYHCKAVGRRRTDLFLMWASWQGTVFFNSILGGFMVKLVEKVIEALHAECIPQSTIDAVMARVRAKPRSGDAHWDMLRSEITEAMYAISSSRTRWRVNRAPVYSGYLKLLHKVRDKIDKVRADNPSLPLSTVTDQAAMLRRAHPDGDFPECGQHWSSWVPPSIRDRTEREFDMLYTAELLEHRDKRAKGTKVPFGSGRRLIPFGTASQRRRIDLKWERLRLDAQSHVDAYTLSIQPGAYPRTATVRALLLARHRAASKAVRVITALQQTANANLVPDPKYMSPPTTWASPTILHKDELDELRAAYRDAGHKGKITDMVGRPVSETPLD